MAAKKKNRKVRRNNSEKNYFSFSSEKKKRIIGIFLILFSIFLFLCIISYSRKDEVLLNNSIFSGVETHNWLGIIGAHFSYFFVSSTIGYFSIVFPAIFFFWGVSNFKKIHIQNSYSHNQLFINYGAGYSHLFWNIICRS